MNLFQVLVLAVVQGLTEFLPVSSSGHLVLLQKLFGLREPPVFLDIFLHVGTLLAVLVFFRQVISQLIIKTGQALQKGQIKAVPPVVWALVVGTIPAVLVGLVLRDSLEAIFSSLRLLSLALFLTSLILFSSGWALSGDDRLTGSFGWGKALVIGLFQALSILPGVSRSGATIVAAQWLKLGRKQAFEFSFLLSVPAILGAMSLQLVESKTALLMPELPIYFLGALLAGFVGWLSLRALRKLVVSGYLYYFGFYTLALALLSLWMSYL